MASESVQADIESYLAEIRLQQSWWMYPIARFFGHVLYGMKGYN